MELDFQPPYLIQCGSATRFPRSASPYIISHQVNAFLFLFPLLSLPLLIGQLEGLDPDQVISQPGRSRNRGPRVCPPTYFQMVGLKGTLAPWIGPG